MKQSFLLKERTKKSYIETIASLAISSRASYQSVLNRLEEFCAESYDGRTLNDQYLSTYGMYEIDSLFASLLEPKIVYANSKALQHHIEELTKRKDTFEFYHSQIDKELEVSL